jgi:hypothetical protein
MATSMKTWLRLSAGLAAGIMLWSGTALGQGKPAGCDKSSASEKVEGEVVSVEPDQGKLTLRAADGTTHVFQASKETIQDYKVGDRIKAKLRLAKDCSK